mmetsp:Transcript_12076/g.15013  ORF Transcript_12076/g.15013 Transcript_12076/m.15013 type:complete len:129 (+) Transcript_12076:1127-1513(+)
MLALWDALFETPSRNQLRIKQKYLRAKGLTIQLRVHQPYRPEPHIHLGSTVPKKIGQMEKHAVNRLVKLFTFRHKTTKKTMLNCLTLMNTSTISPSSVMNSYVRYHYIAKKYFHFLSDATPLAFARFH